MEKGCRKERFVETVFCVETAGSMSSAAVVKQSIKHYFPNLLLNCSKSGYSLKSCRVKIILFSDFLYENEPVVSSPFYNMFDSEDCKKFAAFMENYDPSGGGDAKEYALEALALAMRSEWSDAVEGSVQNIVIFTDDSTHDIGEKDAVKMPTYPLDMPRDFEELRDWWYGKSVMEIGNFDSEIATLQVYSPARDALWTAISEWERTDVYFDDEMTGRKTRFSYDEDES